MSYKGQFGSAKEFTQDRRTFVMYTITLCILSLGLICAISSPSFAASDGWAATYGGNNRDKARSIQQTRDGGYIVAGGTSSFGAGGGDVWVLKLRPDGTVEWQKTYGGDNPDGASSIRQTGDGGYIVAGGTRSFGAGNGDFWVLKLRPDGTIEWQKTYGGDNQEGAFSIQQTTDGGYIVAGATGSFGAEEDEEDYDFWVLKLGHDGTVEWQKAYGGVHLDLADSIQQTSDGGYIVAGSTNSFSAGSNFDFWVLKLAPDGTVEWQKAYGGVQLDLADSIQQTTDGGYIVAGSASSFSAESDLDGWVLKLGPDGTVEWQKAYGGVNGNSALSVQQTGDGGYIVAGWTAFLGAGGVETPDLWVFKLASGGVIEWHKSYGGANGDAARFIQQTSDGGYIVAGETESFGAGEDDFWVLRLRPDGTIDPSCDFIRDTNISLKDSKAAVLNSGALVRDSNAKSKDSSAVVLDTDVSANILCASTAVE